MSNAPVAAVPMDIIAKTAVEVAEAILVRKPIAIIAETVNRKTANSLTGNIICETS